MSYTRPAYNAADATWLAIGAYTRPGYSAADATWYVAPTATYDAYVKEDTGPLQQPAIYVTHSREAWIADGGLPLSPIVFAAQDLVAWATAASPLGAVSIFAIKGFAVTIEDSGLPRPFSGEAFTDPTPFVDPFGSITYSMELVASDGSSIRVPISSWQGTLQKTEQSYLGCVVPACTDYVDALSDATEFVIWRSVPLLDGNRAEFLMARAPLQTLTLNHGSSAYTASLAGYFDPWPDIGVPNSRYDRELQDVQTISTYPSGTRYRAAVDLLLQPGQRAIYGSTSFIVSFINYYVSDTFEYIDLGSRA